MKKTEWFPWTDFAQDVAVLERMASSHRVVHAKGKEVVW